MCTLDLPLSTPLARCWPRSRMLEHRGSTYPLHTSSMTHVRRTVKCHARFPRFFFYNRPVVEMRPQTSAQFVTLQADARFLLLFKGFSSALQETAKGKRTGQHASKGAMFVSLSHNARPLTPGGPCAFRLFGRPRACLPRLAETGALTTCACRAACACSVPQVGVWRDFRNRPMNPIFH